MRALLALVVAPVLIWGVPVTAQDDAERFLEPGLQLSLIHI